MSNADLAARWQGYLNADMAAWDVPADLSYAPGEPGQEPVPALHTTEARCYASWLAFHGYITPEEKRWLYKHGQDLLYLSGELSRLVRC
jgi:hypothetical protein